MPTNRIHQLIAAGLVVATVALAASSGAASAPAKGSQLAASSARASSRIAFISEPPVGGYCGIVYVMNADGSRQQRLADGAAHECAQEGDPAWSPDGRKIAFVSSSKIYVANADGSAQRRLTRTAGFEGSPAWSPDGRKIAFATGREGKFEIQVVNADGSGQRRLTHNAGIDPVWSPDGRRIAFVRSNFEIYVMNADGSGQRRLTHNASLGWSSPVWSPDGRRIAFEGKWQVYVINADGSGQRRLTRNGAHNFNPAWSPDGKRIVFERGRRQRSPCSWCPGLWGYDVYVINADGSGQQRLTRGASQPRWSPDGRKIAFVSKRDGNADIFVMNADGSGQRNLTRGSRNESSPVWSPGRVLAVQVGLAAATGSPSASQGKVRIEVKGNNVDGRFAISGAITDRGRYDDRGGAITVRRLVGVKGTIWMKIGVLDGTPIRCQCNWRIIKGTKAYAGLRGRGHEEGMYAGPYSRTTHLTMYGTVWK